jgi:hypothetical protein
MPRTSLTALRALGPDGSLYTANAADLAMAGADNLNLNQVLHSGKILIVAFNEDASPHTVTVTSATDSNGRTGDITEYSVGAGEYAVFGPFDLDGWAQTDMQLYLTPDHPTLYFGAIDLSHS